MTVSTVRRALLTFSGVASVRGVALAAGSLNLDASARSEHRIEVVSSARIDWMKDLRRLDDEVAARGLQSR